MFDHVGLKVKDLDASVRFYTALLGPLGYEITSQDETVAGFGDKGGSSLWLYADAKLAHSLVHVAFRVASAVPSRRSTTRGGRRAVATTAHPGYARTTAQRTTPRSCSIPTATTSKPCVSNRVGCHGYHP